VAVHRSAKLALAPGAIQGAKRKRASNTDPDDESLAFSDAELAALPDPTPLLPAIATMVVEVISGARSVDQVANLVSDQVYHKLRSRIAAKAASEGPIRPPLMPKFAVGNIRTDSPRPGVIESVVLINTQARTRAVAIRLEPFHKRWRATSVSVL